MQTAKNCWMRSTNSLMPSQAAGSPFLPEKMEAGASAAPGPEPTSGIAATLPISMEPLVPLRKSGQAGAFFELSGGSAFGDLQPVGRGQHEELIEDESVPAA